MHDKILRLFELSELPYTRIKVHREAEHPTWDRAVESIAVTINGAKIELLRFVVSGQVQTMLLLRHSLDANKASVLLHNGNTVEWTWHATLVKSDHAELDQLYRVIDQELGLLIKHEETYQRDLWFGFLMEKNAVVPLVGGFDQNAVKEFVLAVSNGNHTTFAAMRNASVEALSDE